LIQIYWSITGFGSLAPIEPYLVFDRNENEAVGDVQRIIVLLNNNAIVRLMKHLSKSLSVDKNSIKQFWKLWVLDVMWSRMVTLF